MAEALSSLGNADLNQALTMEVRFALRNQAELDQLLKEQEDPASPNYRKWLKSGEFDSRFGARPADVKAVANWLTSEGFTVTETSAESLRFTGNVAMAQRSFSTRIARFGDGTTFANVDDPVVPAQFAGLVGAITGLDNMTRTAPATSHQGPPTRSSLLQLQPELLAFADAATASGNISSVPFANGGGFDSFGPQDMRTFYDETVGNGSDGSGECIAIVGTSDVSPDALNVFVNQFNLPAINVTKVVHGTNPGRKGDGNETEAELDLEWSHSVAPGAAIKFFLSSANDSIGDDVTQAVKDNTCSVISISFGYCGGTPNSEFTGVLDPQFKKAAAQGQSVFVSSGDQGAAGLDRNCNATNTRGVSEMSADPNVTSVGGTQSNPNFDNNGNDVGYSQEDTWNSGGSSGASGGGVSAIFKKPSYQAGPGVPSDANRDIPDVALQAGLPGVFLGDAVGQSAQITCCWGGTSLSAPLMAGFTRVLGQQLGERLGNMNLIFYNLANQQYGPQGASNGFHDITTGNNDFGSVTGFNAGPAYDQTTGWGSIDFDVFATAVKNNPLPTMTPTPTATASILPAPPQINFGNVDATGASKMRKASIVNKGTVEAMVGTVSVPAPFAIVAGTDLCSNQIVLPKKSCTMMLQFAPTATGPSGGSVSVSYNGAPPATVNLSGNGTAVSMKAPTKVAFAPVAAGSTGPSKAITFINLSKTATVQMGSTPSLSGPFQIASDGCSGTTVGPRGKCTIGLQFMPPQGSTSKSTLTGTMGMFSFTYGSNDGAVPSISLTGRVK